MQRRIDKDVIGRVEFQRLYPGMCLQPSNKSDLIFIGDFEFEGVAPDGVEINDCYNLKIVVPASFPRQVPKVWELDEKIKRDGKHHTNPDDSLCLGSPLRLIQKIHLIPSLPGFADQCLVPFLYFISRQRIRGDGFIFGELKHGVPGIVDDYKKIFGLQAKEQVFAVLRLLSLRKRIANKRKCPCNCGLRLGKCSLRYKINWYRQMAPRSWFKRYAQNPGAGID